MPIPGYGVFVAKPVSFIAERANIDNNSPHIYLKFTDGTSNKLKEAAINVKSTDTGDSDLVYWLVPDFEQNELTESLKKLTHGFKAINHQDPDTAGLGLDYLRDNLIDLNQGIILPHDASGPDNDIIDELSPLFNMAIKSGGTIYLFGQRFKQRHGHSDKDGIHDVHMNQGSDPKYGNGVKQDGAIIIHNEDDTWTGVFLAFASQQIPTDDRTGEIMSESKALWETIGQIGQNK